MARNGRMSWDEAVKYLIAFNQKHNITTKGGGPQTCKMVAVITKDSFDKEYTLEERSYEFTNHNKFFIPSNIGNSIFADCLDGIDVGIRLEQYVCNLNWNVEYCYIKEEVA